MLDMTAETPVASTIPEPFSKKPKPGLWHVTSMELPAYVQHVAHALLRNGHAATEGQAIGMAKGIIADWQRGHLPGHKHYHVHADVRAAAAKADAEWQAKRARAHAQAASHDHTRGGDMTTVDLSSKTKKQRQQKDQQEQAAFGAKVDAEKAAEADKKAEEKAARQAKDAQETAAYNEKVSARELSDHMAHAHGLYTPRNASKTAIDQQHLAAHAAQSAVYQHSHNTPPLVKDRKVPRGSAVLGQVGGKMNEVNMSVDLAGDGFMALSEDGSTAQKLASAYDDAEAAFGPDHPHTKRAKAELDKHITGRGEIKSKLIDHLKSVHKLPVNTEGSSFYELQDMHASDHRQHPTMKHTHHKGLQPKGKTDKVDMSIGAPLVFDVAGNRIDLAMTGSLGSGTTHRHRSRYAEDRKESDAVPMGSDKKDEKHPMAMTPEELRAHMSGKHGVSVATHGSTTIQDADSMRKMHAALHPESYDLATSTVEYPSGTKVHHHSKGGTNRVTKMGHGKSPKAVGSKATDKKDDKGDVKHESSGHYVGFEKLVQRIMKKGKSRAQAEALAAFIGRKKYGDKAFNKAAASGKKMGGK